MAELVVSAASNSRFRTFNETQRITIRPGPFISEADEVFAIGSCFAREIRFALRDLGIRVTPNYASLAVDHENFRADNLPEEEHLNYYNAFTILQEVQRALGCWRQTPDDYWRVRTKAWGGITAFQDPYRRLVFGRTEGSLLAVTDNLNKIMLDGFRSASAFVITYGMTEVFRNRHSGRIVAQKPLYGGGGGATETELWRSAFDDNLTAVRETIRLLSMLNPKANIFVTVSPVPLERTFSEDDVYVASTEGKCTLRAVLGQVSREFEHVTYFPAYEMVLASGAASFREVGRHVVARVVQKIMAAFVAAHVRSVDKRDHVDELRSTEGNGQIAGSTPGLTGQDNSAS
jgi:hypothetical protein